MMKCENCTLCCKLLETHDIPSKIGEYCEHCNDIKGCTIYSGRPKECSTYKCMWLQMGNAGIELRPDKSHIIFDKITDRTICARQESGYKLNNLVLRQIKNFNKEGFSVITLNENKKQVFLATDHLIEDIKKDLYDCSSIH